MNFIAAYQLALAGQEEGYRFLYDSTCQPVYEYILQNVDGKDTADRLIGKVYETAWAGLGGLSDPNAFPGWVQGIAESAVMWEKKNSAVSSTGITPLSGIGTGGGTGGVNIAPGVSPNIAQAASPNVANASPNVANASSLSAEHMVAAGGKSAVSGISAGAKAATGAKVAAGTKAAFLSTAAGKAVLGIGCTVAAAALTTGGYFAAKNLTKDEPDTTSTEISSAVIETGESTEIATDTESMATEATEEITATEEMTTTEEASSEAVTEQSTTVAELHDIPVSELPEQEAWYSFMCSFEPGLDKYENGYDCETVISGSQDLYMMLLGIRKGIDYSRYDVLQSVESWGSKNGGIDDPRGYLRNSEWEGGGFRSVSVDGLKWVAINILNIPEDDYDKLSKTFERDECYIEDGRYYAMIGGIGWLGLEYEIKSVRTDGTMYYITYDGVPAHYGYDEATMKAETHTYEAKMELKEFDGKKYWSIYSFHLVK